MSNTAHLDQWLKVTALEEIPVLGSRIIQAPAGQIAIFRNTEDEVFAVLDKCPHNGGPLSQGILHGRSVTCPLHSWNIDFSTGCAVAPDEGYAKSFSVKIESGVVWLSREELQTTDG
ncbi:MAG TPA: nitrite reductase (NAD(P)H) small subunit [Polynucleobacter sp.]|nr:nitrite reductase small subunit NirD [Polynucleobacter necessarius]HAT39636.1 nitrite reductase (NAD(P)H) small subunit [Polynucleobacter sp.]